MCSHLLSYVAFQLENGHLSFSSFMILAFFKENQKNEHHQAVLGSVSYLNNIGWNRPNDLLPAWASDHPLISSPAEASRTISLLLRIVTPFLWLAPCLQSTMSSHIHQNYSTRSKLPSPTWSTCSYGLPIPVSLSGLLFPLQKYGQPWASGKMQGCQTSPEYAKPRLQLSPLPGRAEAASGRVGSQPGCQRGGRGPGRNPEPGPAESACPGFTHRDSHPCDFLEKHFLDEELKFIKDNHLTKLLRPAWDRAGWGPSERLALKHDWTPWPPDFCLSLCLQPKGNFLTNHKPSPKLQTKWKQLPFAETNRQVNVNLRQWYIRRF